MTGKKKRLDRAVINRRAQKTIKGLPEFMTHQEVVKRLGYHQDTLFRGNLLPRITKYLVGSNAFYRKSDITLLEWWLFVREGLIKLNVFSGKIPLGGTDELWKAFQRGDLTHPCPICNDIAVVWHTPWGPKYYCHNCGIVLQTEIYIDGQKFVSTARVRDLIDYPDQDTAINSFPLYKLYETDK